MNSELHEGIRPEKDLVEYLDEAFDRVWLVRKQDLVARLDLGLETIDPEIERRMNEASKKVCEKYDIDFNEPVSDWDYGYWSGVLSTLRWVLGEEQKDFLDT